jgi:hypothetical protein
VLETMRRETEQLQKKNRELQGGIEIDEEQLEALRL